MAQGQYRGQKLYHHVPRRELPFHFFRYFCCMKLLMYRFWLLAVAQKI